MKQYRITSENIPRNEDNDCYLSPDDPIHELKIASMYGGLNAQNRLSAYRAEQNINTVAHSTKGTIQQQMNIKPGTPDWFKLWFSKPNLTGETFNQDEK